MPKIIRKSNDVFVSPTAFTGDSVIDIRRELSYDGESDLAFYQYLFDQNKERSKETWQTQLS